ncbi:thioredoxin family protein [Paenibacillus protaetiae]|uniref:Thioredoxin n=1 Tax=Paenibacillus protaetiae TaxID=2509456 RepID=A0A4P6F9U5_9BACL|nr:thioredoxin family protein [Paenibacillus protaetiae]QAY67258.1 thioredoxin [Paenibacillus protaetiae]
MAIQPIEEKEWLQLAHLGTAKEAILFSTPFCGTCKVAERMLEIADTAGVPVTLYQMNMNFSPSLRDAWKISSVPCLVLLRGGEPVRFEYTMRSVDHIYKLLKEL